VWWSGGVVDTLKERMLIEPWFRAGVVWWSVGVVEENWSEKMDKEWVSLSVLARMAGVPENSARRYVNLFPHFIISKRVNRKHLVLSNCEKTLKRISELFGKGLGRVEVEKQLSLEFSTTIEVEERVKEVLPFSDGSITLNESVLSSFMKIVNGFELMISNQKETLDLLREQNFLLMKRMEKLEMNDGKKTSHSEAVRIVSSMKKLGYGKVKISNKLNEDGVPTMSGNGKWSTSTIGRLLKEID